ncbi:MAG: hypothetical protein RLZZ623_1946 [Actinomycetota bacterium]
MRRTVAIAVLAVLGATTGVVIATMAIVTSHRSDGSSQGASSATLPPMAADAVRVVLDGGAERTTDGDVSVAITGPGSADAVQIDVDPTFAEASWQPLQGPHSIELHDGGYQMVFARTRAGDGSAGPTSVAGIIVDTTWDAATASDDGSPHRVSWVRLVAPDILQVRVEAGRVVWNGAAPDDLVVGRPLDVGPLDQASAYHLDVPGVGGNEGPSASSVSRVSRPNGQATFGEERNIPLVHDLYVQLDRPLPLGAEVQLSFDADVAPATFTIDDATTISPAVHINQVGFRPGDAGKVAMVSAWRGAAGGVTYPNEMAFDVVEVGTGAKAFSGTTTLRASGHDEYGKGDLTGAEVHEADFSELSTPGRYRVCVHGLGCSETFAVSEDSTWRRAAIAVARSAYHQRSGVALGEPFTSITRPRPFHPDDGVVFRQSTLTAIDDPSNVGGDDRFDQYASTVTGEPLTNAWGGHFDAGDWNSRIQHLAYLSVALDLVRLYPDTYGSLSVDIPESGNDIPDVIDEGLWDLDLYRRLQHADGGVPGDVDQSRFATENESSWSNDISVYVYSPDVWSTYIYAGVAAQAAAVLRPYDGKLSATYAASAERAMTWAETSWASAAGSAAVSDDLRRSVDAQRAVAAAAMLELTGDDAWNDVFGAASTIDEAPLDLLDGAGPQGDAAWIYARLDPAVARPEWQSNAVESIVRNADAALAGQASTAFSWVMERPDIPAVWGLGPSTPHGFGLLRAFVMTGDAKYRTAMVRAASFSLGANPLDTSFATGLGANPTRFPLISDSIKVGLPVWPGTFVYGIHDLAFDTGDDWVEQYVLTPAGVQPSPPDAPLLWSWFDVGTLPMMNEFTFSDGHAAALWTLGVLAAT